MTESISLEQRTLDQLTDLSKRTMDLRQDLNRALPDYKAITLLDGIIKRLNRERLIAELAMNAGDK